MQTLPTASPLATPRWKFGRASAHFDGHFLTVSTGAVTRIWRWTGRGLATVSLVDCESGCEWCTLDPASDGDWSNFDEISPGAEAEILGVAARESDDEGFTSPHLEVTATIRYLREEMAARFVIWAYPGGRGIRTQLWWKSSRSTTEKEHQMAGPSIEPVWAEPGIGSMSHTMSSYYELRFRVDGLVSAHRYMALVSWSNPDGANRRQSIDVSSCDGETTLRVVPETSLGAESTAYSFEIPASMSSEGTCIISIPRNAAAPSACIDELAIYADGAGRCVDLRPGRQVQSLADSLPEGFYPAAHISAGALRESVAPTGRERERRVELVPVRSSGRQRVAIGYFNDTQNRNRPETPILREECGNFPVADWASIFCLEDPSGGLAMVKESHKCANQPGVDTGAFVCDERGLVNTRWGLSSREVGSDGFRWCWASWIILYREPGTDSRQRAIKEFDRMRFPTRSERDLWTVACTWGHGRSALEGRDAAAEAEVLREMELARDLGVDMLLIDDGWQVSPRAQSWQPEAGIGWNPHPLTYPEGWTRVREAKERLKLRLGLWAVAQHATPGDPWRNWKKLGMEQVKLDFANLKNHRELDELIGGVRQFLRATGHRCILSWDTTEIQARTGYYWAREYGNVHFMNRKPESPERVIYVPWLALRDFWQLSHYQNLNKWQLTIQNPEVVNREKSDAHLHGADYCVATALMGIPEFMALPRHYSEAARADIRDLLQVYNLHRRAIFEAMVYPVGDEPSNSSWCGFQSWDATSGSGYLTIFRERQNGETQGTLRLRFVSSGTLLQLHDLRTGDERRVAADDEGRVSFEIPVAPGFLFLRYERVENR